MATARRTADHNEIREWVESKGGRPAIVEGTKGMLRIDFDEPDARLEQTDWDTFFRIFDRSNVDFLYNPAGGMVKFVEREGATRSAARRGAPRKTSGRKKSNNGRKKSSGGRKKSTGGRKKSTGGRKKSTGGRKKTSSSRGRKKSTDGRRKKSSSNGRKKSSSNGRKKSTGGRKKGGRKYSKKAQKKVGRVMHEYKHGELKSGRSGRKVKNRKQAIAIGISEARREGDKAPRRRGGRRKKS